MASRGTWRLYRLHALFNRIALEVIFGNVQNVLIEVQSQIGKSQFWDRYFPAWFLGNFPNLRFVLSSYERTFARSWGRQARDVMEEFGEELFGLKVRQDSHAADDWSIEGYEGGMMTTSVDGPLTGRAVDVLLTDDPFKNAEEAQSATRKKVVWEWWESSVGSRERRGMRKIVLGTRWAVDDLAGRIRSHLIETGRENWLVVSLPAVAEKDESLLGGWWKRAKGEVLCPEMYSLEDMEARKRKLSSYWWSTMYQQQPFPRGGGRLKRHWFDVVEPEDVPELVKLCRAWDLAASESEKAKQSAGVKLGLGEDGELYVLHSMAGWWSSGKRDGIIRNVAEADGTLCRVAIEQEPGSGGKAQCESLERQLRGFNVIRASASKGGSKELRADPLASFAENGHVHLVRGPWNSGFLDQVESFPDGLIDQVDAAAHAYNYLSGRVANPSVSFV